MSKKKAAEDALLPYIDHELYLVVKGSIEGGAVHGEGAMALDDYNGMAAAAGGWASIAPRYSGSALGGEGTIEIRDGKAYLRYTY